MRTARYFLIVTAPIQSVPFPQIQLKTFVYLKPRKILLWITASHSKILWGSCRRLVHETIVQNNGCSGEQVTRLFWAELRWYELHIPLPKVKLHMCDLPYICRRLESTSMAVDVDSMTNLRQVSGRAIRRRLIYKANSMCMWSLTFSDDDVGLSSRAASNKNF